MVRRLNILGSPATTELSRFVVYLSLPGLLFEVIAHTSWTDVWQPGFVVAFGVSSLVMFLSTVIIVGRGSDQLADAAIMGLNVSYPNTGFMGFPLAMALFGRLSLPLTLIATILTVSVIFALAIVLTEVGTHSVRDPSRILAAASRSLITNPDCCAGVWSNLFDRSRNDPSAVGRLHQAIE